MDGHVVPPACLSCQRADDLYWVATHRLHERFPAGGYWHCRPGRGCLEWLTGRIVAAIL